MAMFSKKVAANPLAALENELAASRRKRDDLLGRRDRLAFSLAEAQEARKQALLIDDEADSDAALAKATSNVESYRSSLQGVDLVLADHDARIGDLEHEIAFGRDRAEREMKAKALEKKLQIARDAFPKYLDSARQLSEALGSTGHFHLEEASALIKRIARDVETAREMLFQWAIMPSPNCAPIRSRSRRCNQSPRLASGPATKESSNMTSRLAPSAIVGRPSTTPSPTIRSKPMARPRWKPPYPPTRPYNFTPPLDDPPRSATRSSAPTKSRAEIAALREATAAHEAGHAIVTMHYGQRVAYVGIADNGSGLMSLSHRPVPLEASSVAEDGRSFDDIASGLTSLSRSEIYPTVVEYEAGAIAESLFDVDARHTEQSAREDHRRSRVLARQVCDDEDDAREFVAKARRRATRILEANMPLLRELAGELETRGRLDADDIDAIVADFPLERPREPKQAPKRAAATSSRPYTDRGPSALGLHAPDCVARMPPLSMHERACSPHDEHLFRTRMRFLDSRALGACSRTSGSRPNRRRQLGQ